MHESSRSTVTRASLLLQRVVLDLPERREQPFGILRQAAQFAMCVVILATPAPHPGTEHRIAVTIELLERGLAAGCAGAAGSRSNGSTCPRLPSTDELPLRKKLKMNGVLETGAML
jgi:hypothetical protein